MCALVWRREKCGWGVRVCRGRWSRLRSWLVPPGTKSAALVGLRRLEPRLGIRVMSDRPESVILGGVGILTCRIPVMICLYSGCNVYPLLAEWLCGCCCRCPEAFNSLSASYRGMPNKAWFEHCYCYIDTQQCASLASRQWTQRSIVLCSQHNLFETRAP